ncbi:MAG: DMT family transporter [Propionibacteriaceae bacterium]
MTTAATPATPHTDTLPTEGPGWRVLLAAAITVVAWASAFVVIRDAGPSYSPGALSLGRLVIGTAALSLLMIGRRWVRPSKREWALIVLIGVAWFGVYNVALNAGERSVDAGTAAMLIQLAPILIGLLAGFLLGEGFPKMLVIGGLVAFAGTLMIGIATSTGQADTAGVLLVLLAAVVYAAAVVAQKVVLRRVPGAQVTFLACLIGMIACLPFAGVLARELAVAPVSATLGLVYLGLVPTAIAFSTWAYALTRTDAGRLGATTYIVPLVTIILGWTLLGEVPVPLAIVGGLVSLVGVALSRLKTQRA